MTQATNSQIAMWRGAIALVWADNAMHDRERIKLLEYFNGNLYLTNAQRAQLIRDMDRKIELKDVWSDITHPEDRAHLIDIAPSLFSERGKATPEEQALYDQMLADQMATIDVKKLEQEIREIKSHIPYALVKDEAEYEKEFEQSGALGRTLYQVDKMLDKVP